MLASEIAVTQPSAMPTVHFTRHLLRFFPSLATTEVEASTVAAVVSELERRHRGLADYLVDERGALRKHVNIFVGDELVRDRDTLSDPVAPDSQVHVIQALSGG
ncbi:MAG: MoaD/ThiS family protein [Actinomycetota bacterium]